LSQDGEKEFGNVDPNAEEASKITSSSPGPRGGSAAPKIKLFDYFDSSNFVELEKDEAESEKPNE